MFLLFWVQAGSLVLVIGGPAIFLPFAHELPIFAKNTR
jgi:hypothetical protein